MLKSYSKLILILEAGGHVVEWNKDDTLQRTSRSALLESLQNDIETLKKLFHSEKEGIDDTGHLAYQGVDGR